MKRISAFFALASISFLLLPQISFAQETPQFAVSVHGNTGSPPMLGVSYFFSDRIAVRGSAGFYPETGGYDVATTETSARRVTYDTQWYGGALAGLYYLPNLWRVHPYTGLKTQYVVADSESNSGLSQADDRLDAGALAGAELRVLSWLRLSGEVGVGYRSGLNRNSAVVPLSGMLNSSEFGLMHAGLGIQVQIR